MSRTWTVSDLHQELSDDSWDPAADAPAGGFVVVTL